MKYTDCSATYAPAPITARIAATTASVAARRRRTRRRPEPLPFGDGRRGRRATTGRSAGGALAADALAAVVSGGALAADAVAAVVSAGAAAGPAAASASETLAGCTAGAGTT